MGGAEGPSATRTIDRTLLCTTLRDALGTRVVLSTASPKSATSPRASAGVLALGPTMSDHRTLVSAHAAYRLGPGVLVSRSTCGSSSFPVPLTSRGLPGPPTWFSTDAKCAAGPRVLIRVRATLRDWKGWTRVPADSDRPAVRDLDFARGVPVQLALAVRTYPGKRPLTFATFDRRGRSTFHSANFPRCGLP